MKKLLSLIFGVLALSVVPVLLFSSELSTCPESGPKNNCLGTWESDGSKYVGEYQNDSWSGKGILTYDGILHYEGEFKDGLFNGLGTLKLENGETHVGEFKDNMKNGPGITNFSDGSVYEGEYQRNRKHGLGTMTWADGVTYSGHWKEDNFEGQGTYTFTDGWQYSGDWRYFETYGNSIPHGEGKVNYGEGKKTYSGSWSYGQYDGAGTEIYPDGSKYVGNWKNGLKCGEGSQFDADGFAEIGIWVDGDLDTPFSEKCPSNGTFDNCYGEKKFGNQERYVGQFVNDLFDGYGTYYHERGEIFKGTWKNGKKHGTGTQISTDGEKSEGIWINDVFWIDIKHDLKSANSKLPKCSSSYLHQCVGIHDMSGGKYIGEWQHNRKHGRGTYRFIDGTAVHAVFEDGNRVGKGVFTYGRGNRCGKVDLETGYSPYFSDNEYEEEFKWCFEHHTTGEYLCEEFQYLGSNWAPDGRRNSGEFKFFNGDRYIGEWILFNKLEILERGQYDVTNIDKVATPSGNVEAAQLYGRMHGAGIFSTSTGEVFEGIFEKGERHGKGSFIYANGDKYVGLWQNNKRSGIGTTTYANGIKFKGHYENDLRHGEGTLDLPDGISKGGIWQEDYFVFPSRIQINLSLSKQEVVSEVDIKHPVDAQLLNKSNLMKCAVGKRFDQCFGTHAWPDGTTYIGEWKRNKSDGIGQLFYPDGRRYLGEFKNGKLNGEGKYTWALGYEYEGIWRNNVKTGLGKLIYSDGREYQGAWKNDKWHGKGTLSFPDGTKILGLWSEGDMRSGEEIFASSDSESSGSDELKISDWPKGEHEIGWMDTDGSIFKSNITFYDEVLPDGTIGFYGYNSRDRIVGKYSEDQTVFEGYWVSDGGEEQCSSSMSGSEFYGRIWITLENEKQFVGIFSECDAIPELVLQQDWYLQSIYTDFPWVKTNLPLCPKSGFYDNCFGARQYGDGADPQQYIGEFQGDERHGLGRLMKPNLSVFIGDWKNDRATGFGHEIYTHAIKRDQEYIGEFKNGLLHGFGTLIFGKKQFYSGDFKDGKFDGYGSTGFFWKDYRHKNLEQNNWKYSGGYKDGKMHGKGVYVNLVSGEKQEGIWEEGSLKVAKSVKIDERSRNFEKNLVLPDCPKQGYRHICFGKFTKDGIEDYLGEFRKGFYNGLGELTLADGSIYSGQFLKDKKHGQGLLQSADGTIQEGIWDENDFIQAKIILPNCNAEKDFDDCFGSYSWPDGSHYVGDFKKNNFNGYGIFIYSDGNRYEGEWKDNKRDGKGTFTDAKGNTYEGLWKEGKRHGNGSLKFKGPVKFAPDYQGEWHNDERHGVGVLTYSSGKAYRGDFKNDKKHGVGKESDFSGNIIFEGYWNDGNPIQDYQGKECPDDLWVDDRHNCWAEDYDPNVGTYLAMYQYGKRNDLDGRLKFLNGDEYIGEFTDGSRTGFGTLTSVSGYKYTGNWVRSKMHGKGIMIFEDGTSLDGNWINGKAEGLGTLTYSSGKIYIGEFKADKFYGKGEIKYVNGSIYKGDFIDGRKSGRGTFSSEDGDIYTGGFKNGEKHGKGELILISGERYKGTWRADKKHGKGSLFYANGDKYIGGWKNDKRHGKGVLTFADGSEKLAGNWKDNELQK